MPPRSRLGPSRSRSSRAWKCRVAAIAEAEILRDIVGQVEAIEDRGGDVFDVRIGLATATIGREAGQFLNMVFGNTSLHADVVLLDVEIPAELAAAFGGPRHGIDGLRQRVGASAVRSPARR